MQKSRNLRWLRLRIWWGTPLFQTLAALINPHILASVWDAIDISPKMKYSFYMYTRMSKSELYFLNIAITINSSGKSGICSFHISHSSTPTSYRRYHLFQSWIKSPSYFGCLRSMQHYLLIFCQHWWLLKRRILLDRRD